MCKVAGLSEVIKLPKHGEKVCVVEVSDIAKSQIRWCAPEYLKKGRCSRFSDAWSFGVLMWEMAHPDLLPYSNFGDDEVAAKIKTGYSLTIPSDYPKQVQIIMRSCWSSEPTRRPTFLHINWSLNQVNFS